MTRRWLWWALRGVVQAAAFAAFAALGAAVAQGARIRREVRRG